MGMIGASYKLGQHCDVANNNYLVTCLCQYRHCMLSSRHESASSDLVPAVFRKQDVERFEIKILLPFLVGKGDLSELLGHNGIDPYGYSPFALP
jgi:hypothetical protein